MQSNLGGQIEWGVEFASFPTTGDVVFGPTFDGGQQADLVFVPEPSTGLLVSVAISYAAIAARRSGH